MRAAAHPAPQLAAVRPVGRARQIAILGACCTAIAMLAIDQTVVSVALPSIGRSLHTTLAGLQWTAAGYTIASAALMMISGAAGDRFGSRTVFQTGLFVFTVASLYCSLASDTGWLVASRILQGAGGSALAPMSMALIRRTFADPAARTRAMGVWTGAFGVGMAAGPVLGGLLVGLIGWRSAFWVNVPVGVAGLVLVSLLVPRDQLSARPRKPDLPGQFLVIAFLGSLTYMIVEAPSAGWRSPVIAGCAAAAAASLAALLAVEPRRAEPLIELRYFRSLAFSGAVVITVCSFAVAGGFLFLTALYLQDVRLMTPVQAGLHLLPCAAGVLAASLCAGRLMARHGARWPLVAGGAALTLSAAALSRMTSVSSLSFLIVTFAVLGIGYGCVNAVVSAVAVEGMPPAQAGVAGGICSSSRLVGQALGTCVAGSVVAAGMKGNWQTFCPAAFAAWSVMAACGFAALTLGAIAGRASATPRPRFGVSPGSATGGEGPGRLSEGGGW